ncbi:MAG TPA: efflux RND transporter periplasmic adaptor subunit [Pseudacidobacterium sp.]|jgi:HlyD family secretion protein|nr:efflux RND transporter periplasmic adaptor subunit [Pseudacidobacterium sp.]
MAGTSQQPQAVKKNSRWFLWVRVILLIAIIVIGATWFVRRPKLVSVVNPKEVSLTETIASSARVGGVLETGVGSQFTGTVERLFVREGDRVKAGQPIAVLRNAVTQQQQVQAQKAVDTARSELAQTSKGPTAAEIAEAENSIAEARAQAAQAKSDLGQAQRDYARSQQMIKDGTISRADFEASQTKASTAKALVKSSEATVRTREARLQILKETPRPEDVQVARNRLNEAQQAFSVAKEQVRDANVTAPFNGVVTKINAEVGQTVGSAGVVDLVSDDLELRVDLDENNLADLALGQSAIISSNAFSGNTFKGRLSEIGASVNQERGTIQVKITPEDPPDWLRPGQTVNVNLITNEQADRLMVPSTAVMRQGERSVVLVAENGHALEKIVLTRPVTSEGIPIAGGLSTTDEVIANPSGLSPGQAVRVRK